MPNTSTIGALFKKINIYKTVIGVLVNMNDTGPIISMYVDENHFKTPVGLHTVSCMSISSKVWRTWKFSEVENRKNQYCLLLFFNVMVSTWPLEYEFQN